MSKAINIFNKLAGHLGKKGPTLKEYSTYTPAKLQAKYPKYYRSESDAFSDIVSESGKSKDYQKAVAASSKYRGGSKRKTDKYTRTGRDAIKKYKLPTNIQDYMFDKSWGGKDWKYDPVRSIGKNSPRGKNPKEKMLKERARQLAAGKSPVAPGAMSRYNPSSQKDYRLQALAESIIAERRAMPQKDLDRANRYTDAGEGEVPQVMDSGYDQALYERRVAEFRQALNKLMPYIQAKPPKV